LYRVNEEFDMGYLISLGEPKNVAETLYAVASAVDFANLNSCVGIVVRAEASLLAIHLVATQGQQSFDAATAQSVIDTIKRTVQNPKGVILVGYPASWSDDNQNGAERAAVFLDLQAKLVELLDGNYEKLQTFAMPQRLYELGARCRATISGPATQPAAHGGAGAEHGEIFGVAIAYHRDAPVLRKGNWVRAN
jgi:hypothetical protein